MWREKIIISFAHAMGMKFYVLGCHCCEMASFVGLNNDLKVVLKII